MHLQKLYPLLLLPLAIASCIGKAKPNLTAIDADLGIIIPQHKLLIGDSDPFGLGSDTKNTFVFQFDSAHFKRLEEAIAHSPLYNVAHVHQFQKMNMSQQSAIVKALATHRLTGYWIKSDSGYWFDGDSVLQNNGDTLVAYLASKHIFLPNQDSSRIWNGRPATVYWLKAVIDRRQRTLFYQYTHT